MSQAITRQHPAVVLRSHYAQLRNLLAVAMIAIVGLSGAVVILANEQDDVSSTTSAKATESANPVGSPRYFKGVEQSAAGPKAAQAPGTRFDGGPDEGTRGITAPAPGTRFDGGPDEGTRGIVSGPAPGTRFDGGPDEGSRGIASPSATSDAGSQETPHPPGIQHRLTPGSSRTAKGPSVWEALSLWATGLPTRAHKGRSRNGVGCGRAALRHRQVGAPVGEGRAPPRSFRRRRVVRGRGRAPGPRGCGRAAPRAGPR